MFVARASSKVHVAGSRELREPPNKPDGLEWGARPKLATVTETVVAKHGSQEGRSQTHQQGQQGKQSQ